MRSSSKLAAFVVMGAVGASGCAPSVADGARQVYSVASICPLANVQLRERSDVAPHTVLAGTSAPPGVSLDSVGDTYELTGCGKRAVYVCGRPYVSNHEDPFSVAVASDAMGQDLTIHTPYFAETRALDVDGSRIPSMVVCQPAASP